MSEVNVPLLRKVLEHITAHPGEWDQEHWASRSACGTAYCLAGHTVMMTGHEIEWTTRSELGLPGQGQATVAVRLMNLRTIAEAAAEELGLTQGEGIVLFASNNTLKQLWQIASVFANGEIEIPKEFQ